jgi:hypothetical protein
VILLEIASSHGEGATADDLKDGDNNFCSAVTVETRGISNELAVIDVSVVVFFLVFVGDDDGAIDKFDVSLMYPPYSTTLSSYLKK